MQSSSVQSVLDSLIVESAGSVGLAGRAASLDAVEDLGVSAGGDTFASAGAVDALADSFTGHSIGEAMLWCSTSLHSYGALEMAGWRRFVICFWRASFQGSGTATVSSAGLQVHTALDSDLTAGRSSA